MTSYSLSHLSDLALLHSLATIVSQDCATTASLLAHIAEVDERKLFVESAYDSMHAYCVRELHMSEDMAYKRIQVARAARRFPAIFQAVAEGKLHLTAVVVLAPHLSPETADSLLVAATYRTRAEIEQLLAERFPRPDLPTVVQALAPATTANGSGMEPAGTSIQLVPEPVAPPLGSIGPGQMESFPSRAKVAPIAPDRFALQLTIRGHAHDLLRYAQALLGHAVPSGDVAQVIERALVSLVRDLEKRKFARCARSRQPGNATRGRHIPAAVRRAVFERDGGQCTFVSEAGKRCESSTRLEFDHVEAFALGGQATVGGIRLLCRAHNQHMADCALGRTFMEGKRQLGRERTATARATAGANAHTDEQEQARVAAEAASQNEVIPWLRALGCNVETARRAAARCAGMVGVPLEKRVRVAVQSLGPPSARRLRPMVTSPA